MSRAGNWTGTNKTFLSVYRQDKVGLGRPKADPQRGGRPKPVGCDAEQVKAVPGLESSAAGILMLSPAFST